MGSVVISVDAELGWGFHDLDPPSTTRVEVGRAGWRTLLDVFERYDVPATWAVVGHLLLAGCDGRHADHPTPDGWFDTERGAWADRPELRCAPDLVADTAASPVGHEIGCHTFSHVLFGETTGEVAAAELAAARAAAPPGIEYETFVFPRNAVGHRELLADHGFTCYRSRGPRTEGRTRRTAHKLRSAVDPGRARLVTPTVDEHGLVDLPPSLFLFEFEGAPRRLTETVWDDPVVRHAKHGVDRAAREPGVFHLWLHPNNLRAERDAERVRRIVAYAADRREATPLSIETMGEVAERTLRTPASLPQ